MIGRKRLKNEVLAYGQDVWEQIWNNPVALEKHRRVLPDIEILDENSIGTGQFKMQTGGGFTTPLWS